MRSLWRLIRLWRLYAGMNLLWITRDMKLCFAYYVSDTAVNIAAVTGMLLLAERFQGIGAWTKDQMLFMLGYALAVDGILAALFGFNILFISRRVGRGQIDHLLVQPQPLWMALLSEGFMPFDGVGSLLPGVGLMVWASRHMSLGPTSTGTASVPGAWPDAWSGLWPAVWPGGAGGLLAVNLAASCAIVTAFSFLWGSLAFVAPRAAEEISSSALGLIGRLKSFPLDGLRAGIAAGLLTAVPAGFVAWYPCRALLGLDAHRWSVIVTPAAAVPLSLVAYVAFHRGLIHYGRTGSQRYLSFGHRR